MKDLWYWKAGLHDAKIRSVSEKAQAADWKNGIPACRCLEILLKSGSAYERDIRKIILFDAHIRELKREGESADLGAFTDAHWQSDRLTELAEKGFFLELEAVDSEDSTLYLCVEFETAKVEHSGQ